MSAPAAQPQLLPRTSSQVSRAGVCAIKKSVSPPPSRRAAWLYHRRSFLSYDTRQESRCEHGSSSLADGPRPCCTIPHTANGLGFFADGRHVERDAQLDARERNSPPIDPPGNVGVSPARLIQPLFLIMAPEGTELFRCEVLSDGRGTEQTASL